MRIQKQLLSGRPYVEQKVITLLRCLAGDGADREAARRAVKYDGGDEHTINIIARMVGIALLMGLRIQSMDCPNIDVDEQHLISTIAYIQHEIELKHDKIDNDLLEATFDAALVLAEINLRLPSVSMKNMKQS